MLDSIRFIHTGDLHLGSPLKAVGEISERLKKSLIESSYTAIKNIVDAALEHNVDFVLMCGDIYDNEARSVKGNRFLTRQMNAWMIKISLFSLSTVIMTLSEEI